MFGCRYVRLGGLANRAPKRIRPGFLMAHRQDRRRVNAALDQLSGGVEKRLPRSRNHHLAALDPAVKQAIASCRLLHNQDHGQALLQLDPLEPRDVQQSPAFPDWSFSFLDFRGAGDSF